MSGPWSPLIAQGYPEPQPGVFCRGTAGARFRVTRYATLHLLNRKCTFCSNP